MKGIEIIERVDSLEYNQYDTEQKLRWLHQLDGQIYREVIERHEGAPPMPPSYITGQEELLVGEPYGEPMYTSYLLAQIALYNGEMSRYNTHGMSYNNQYMAWSADYNRTHMPTGARQFIF